MARRRDKPTMPEIEQGDSQKAEDTKDDKTPPSKGGRQITTNLSPDDFRRLKLYCLMHDAKQYEVVRDAITQYLDRAEK